KYNLTDIAAALGLVQPRRASEFFDARTAIAQHYTTRLAAVPDVTLPTQHADRRNSWHLFAVRIGHGSRDRVIDALRAGGVTPSVHWLPLHRMPYYRDLGLPQLSTLERADRLGSELVSLPIYPGMPSAAVDHVCDVLSDSLAHVLKS